MRRIALFVAVLAVVILSVPVTAASGWTSPRRVWDAAYTQPSMVVDAHGAVHIAARGTNGLWYLTNETGNWTRVRLTRDRPHDGGTARDGSPQIALDRWDGSLTIVYAVDSGDCCPGSISLAYVTNRDAGGSGAWSAPRHIPYGSAADTALSVVVRHGVIAIAVNTGLYDATQVQFITNATGHWTHEDITATTKGRWAGDPSLALDRDGRPVIAYQVHGRYPKANAIRIAVGTRPTGGFVTERAVAVPGAANPSLVLDAKGRPRFGFDANDGTHEARSTASGWKTRLVWHGGHDSQLRLGPGGHSRIVGLRDVSKTQAWFAMWSSGAWQRTQLTSQRTREVAFAVGKADGRNHVVFVAGDRLWYTHSW